MTRFELHVEKWKDCTRCDLHKGRSRVVFARGSLPCDILFIGEAPGKEEDVYGIPFIGRAGKLLDRIIERSIPETLTYALTNLVCCVPLDSEDHAKTTQPLWNHIDACRPRLQEFVEIVSPRLVILVGKLPQDNIVPTAEWSVKFEAPTIGIKHPAAILRNKAGIIHQDLEVNKAVIAISNAVDKYLLEDGG